MRTQVYRSISRVVYRAEVGQKAQSPVSAQRFSSLRRTPLLTPPPGTSQVAQAWHFPWQGKRYLIYHAHEARNETYASLHVSEVDAAFEHTKHLGVFYDRKSVSPDNVAQMSPCFVTEGDRLYLFTNIGPRLNQKIALAIAEIPSNK